MKVGGLFRHYHILMQDVLDATNMVNVQEFMACVSQNITLYS